MLWWLLLRLMWRLRRMVLWCLLLWLLVCNLTLYVLMRATVDRPSMRYSSRYRHHVSLFDAVSTLGHRDL